jgi:predicted nucleotidyltransferase
MTVTATETALHLRARQDVERQHGKARAERLLALSTRARSLLVERHGARRVWLFGSLASGQPTADSDVDLAVDGLAGSAYFTALADLMALFRGPVDLVCLEDAPESLRERILTEGREL